MMRLTLHFRLDITGDNVHPLGVNGIINGN